MSVRLRVLAALTELGPMTRVETAEELGLSRDEVGSAFTKLIRSDDAHIGAWRTDHEGQRKYLRAVYAPGPGKPAPKPALRIRDRRAAREYRDRLRSRAPSVFACPVRIVLRK